MSEQGLVRPGTEWLTGPGRPGDRPSPIGLGTERAPGGNSSPGKPEWEEEERENGRNQVSNYGNPFPML